MRICLMGCIIMLFPFVLVFWFLVLLVALLIPLIELTRTYLISRCNKRVKEEVEKKSKIAQEFTRKFSKLRDIGQIITSVQQSKTVTDSLLTKEQRILINL
jgi:Na+-transporting methylmalonyl-CoA/oxaloacetate decarboxylase gamma subunit